MRSKISALWVCLLLPAATLAQSKTYTVQQGDTISAIADRLGIPQAELIRSNGIANPHQLRLGQELLVPKADAKPEQKVSDRTYTVKNGDHDWALSRRFGISMAALHQANPSIDWNKLQIGTKVTIPGQAPEEKVEKRTVVAKQETAKKPTVKTATYRVKSGDSDWLIARRHDTTMARLYELNPNVNFQPLQIGVVIKVPAGSSAVAKAPASKDRFSSSYALVTNNGTRIRTAPNTGSRVITVVGAGVHVKVLDKSSGWSKLKFPGGTVGWVRNDLLNGITATRYASIQKARDKALAKRPARQNSTKVAKATDSGKASSGAAAGGTKASKLIAYAYSLRGTRYRWGGTSRSGFDCSGFTTNVFKKHGISLPRTSAAQSGAGSKVSKGSLKAGDLVFFKTRSSSRINHVGIYVGNGQFIHSSSGKGAVRVDSLNSGYYSRRYVTGRRVLK